MGRSEFALRAVVCARHHALSGAGVLVGRELCGCAQAAADHRGRRRDSSQSAGRAATLGGAFGGAAGSVGFGIGRTRGSDGDDGAA